MGALTTLHDFDGVCACSVYVRCVFVRSGVRHVFVYTSFGFWFFLQKGG